LIKRALLGDTVTVGVSGQKGSGKTHTLLGKTYTDAEQENLSSMPHDYFRDTLADSESGISVRILEEMFAQINNVAADRR